MNKIYKITWNHSRAQYMVSHEHTRAHRKGRLSATLLGGLLAGALIASPIAMASTISVDSVGNKVSTQIIQSGNRYDIRTSEVTNNNVGINRFKQFDLDKGHIANLHHAENSSTLVNFVNEHINVNGTVNSVKNSKIGGELFFVSPKGMTVSESGVINTGSLTVIAPTDTDYEKWKELGDYGPTNEDLLDAIRQGEVPLNRNATITINGSINAGNAVTLAASNIKIGSAAKISTKITDFSNLVNIKDDNGKVILESEITSGELVGRVDNSGDVILSAIGDTAFEKFVKEETSAKIEVAGKIESRKNITVKAKAGNGNYDQKTGTFIVDSSNYDTKVKAEVAVSGTLDASKDITVSADAINTIDNTGTVDESGASMFNTAKVEVLNILGTVTPFNLDVAYGGATTTATVSVTKDALLKAENDVSVTANADSRLAVGASTATYSIFSKFHDPATWEFAIPSTATVVGLIDNTALIDIKGSIETAGDLTIGSKSNITAELTADAGTMQSPSPSIAFVTAIFNGQAKTNIDAKSITISSDSSNLSHVTFYADQTSDVTTTAETSIEAGVYGGLTFNYTELNTDSILTLNTPITNKADSITVRSSNVTSALNMTSNVGIGAFDFVKRAYDALYTAPLDFVAGLMGKVSYGIDSNFTDVNFRLGAAVGVVAGTQDSALTIYTPSTNTGAGLYAQNGIEIRSESLLKDHHYYVNNRVETIENLGTKAQAGISLLVTTPGEYKPTTTDDSYDPQTEQIIPTVSATLDILDGSTLKVDDGNLTISSEAVISWTRVDVMKNEILGIIEDLRDIWTESSDGSTEYQQLWAEVEKAWTTCEQAFDYIGTSESFLGNLYLLGFAMGEFTTAASEFLEMTYTPIVDTASSSFDLLFSSLDFASPVSYVNSYVASSGGSSEGAYAVAGSVGFIAQQASSQLTIGKNVSLEAKGTDTPADGENDAILRGRVHIVGRTENDAVALGGHLKDLAGMTIPNFHDANSIGATFLLQTLDTNNLVRIREGVTINADNAVVLSAEDGMSVIAIGASSNISKGTLDVDMLMAVSIANANNTIELDDEIDINTKDLTITAHRDDDLQTIAGTLLVSTGDTGGYSAGASLAINSGELKNQVELIDNDKLQDNETSVLDKTGRWKASQNISVVADADVAMNAISVAGSVAVAFDPNDPTPGALTKAANWVMKTLKIDKALVKVDGLLRSLSFFEDYIVTKAHSYGTKIHDHVAHNQSQNHVDNNLFNQNTNDPGYVDLTQTGQNQANTGPTQNVNTGAVQQFSINASGTLSLNDLDTTNEVVIDIASMIMDSSTVNMDAVIDKWVGTWAGTASITYIAPRSIVSPNHSVGIAGAVAINASDFTSKVSIKKSEDSESTGLVIQNTASDNKYAGTNVAIYAINDGAVVVEGLTGSVTATGKGAYSFDANVSANFAQTTTETAVDGLTLIDPTVEGQTNAYDQAAWSGDTQVTGGTGFGLSLSQGTTGNSASLGFIVAIADIDNTITSTLSNADISAKYFDIRALSSLVQVTTAINAQIAAANSTLGLAGTAASAYLSNTVNASVSDSSITLTSDGAHAQIIARDANSSEHETMDQITDIDFAFDQLTTYNGDQATTTAISKENNDYYSDVALITDEERKSSQNVAEFLNGANMVQSTTVISLGVSADGGAALGAAVLVNDIDNAFTTSAKNLDIEHVNETSNAVYTQSAESDVVSVSVVAGVAGGGSKFSASGSVIVSDIDQATHSIIKDSEVNVAENNVLAGNESISVNVAGNVGVSAGQSGVGVGAAVVVANTNNTAQVTASNLTHDYNNATLNIKALNQAQSWAAAADAGVSASLTFGGSVVVNRVKNATAIDIDHLLLNNISTATISSSDESQLWSLAGQVSVAYSGAVGASGAVAYTLSGGSDVGTTVDVSDVTVTTDAPTQTDLTIEALGRDHVTGLTLATGISGSGAGIAGVAGTNEIKRNVNAQLANVTSGSAEQHALNRLVVKAYEDADIDNVGLVVSAGSTASVGAGIAVNRINNTTQASLLDTRDTKSNFFTDSLIVSAVTDNDIDTVGVGGGGAGTLAINGSVAVNLIESDTKVSIDGTQASMNVGVIEARSDDTIGTYGGQANGSGTVALGLTVTVSEKKGGTDIAVNNATLTELGSTESEKEKITVGVKDEHIKDAFVSDISTVASLSNNRDEATVDGISMTSTSTETFKTFLINAAGSGMVTAVGTSNVVYSGGSTNLTIDGSNISTEDGLDTLVGNYTSVDTSMSTASGGQVAVAASVNVTTTEHNVNATFSDSTISGDVTHQAEAKEGLSHLILSLAGSLYASVSPTVNVNRLLSDVSSSVSNSTITGGTYSQNSYYLGHSHGASGLLAGAIASVGANVNVNYYGNDVTNSLDGSKIDTTGDQTIVGLRQINHKMVDVTATGGAAALGGYVNVNTIEGLTQTNVKNTHLESDSNITVSAENLDVISLVGVQGQVALGAAGANVVVNSVYGDAQVNAINSTLIGKNIDIQALQNRQLTATSVMASGGIGALQANVIVNNVGSSENAFATSETGLSDTEELVNSYINTYASSSDTDNPGLLDSILTETETLLSAEEQTALLGAAATNASLTKSASGTNVSISTTQIKATDNLTVKSGEDTSEEAKTDVAVGSGSLAGLVVAASVGTLRYHHNANVLIASSILEGRNTTVGSYIDGTKTVSAYQASASIASGLAAYSDIVIDVGALVDIENSDIKSSNQSTIEFQDTSIVKTQAFGITVSGITGGGMVGHLEDRSSSRVNIQGHYLNGTGLTGNTTIRSLRAGQRISDTTAGYGASFAGIGAIAKVYDSGTQEIVVDSTKVTAKNLTIDANNQMQLSSEATGAGGAIATIGVVEVRTHATGSTQVTAKNNTFDVENTVLQASSGRQGNDDSQALRLNAYASAYSGSVSGVSVNVAELNNYTQTSMTFVDNTMIQQNDRQERLDTDVLGYAVYDGKSDVAGGAVGIYSGNTEVQIDHGVKISNTIDASGKELHVDIFDAVAHNEENAKAIAESYGGATFVIEGSTENLDNAADIYHTDLSETSVNLIGTVTADKEFNASVQSTNRLQTKVDNTKGAIGGGSGAAINNEMTGSTLLKVADNAQLTSGEDMYLGARSDVELTGIKDSSGEIDSVVVESAVYGAFTGTGIHIKNNVTRVNQIEIGSQSSVIADDRLAIDAKAVSDIDWRVEAISAGMVEGVNASATHNLKTANIVNIGSNATLKNRNADELIIVSASGNEQYHFETIGDVQGALIGGAGAVMSTHYERQNLVNIASGAKIEGAGEIQLLSGQDSDNQLSLLDMTTYSHAYSSSVITGVNAENNNQFTTSDQVNVDGDVTATRSITVYADQGEVNTKEEVRLYTFYSADDWGKVEIATTESGKMSSNMTENSRLTVTGSLVAGTQTKFDLSISGVVDTDDKDSVTIEGSQKEPTIKLDSNVSATIESGEVDIANQYWERHQYLVDQMAEYAITNATSENESIYYALKAEDDYLVQEMLQRGFATQDQKGNLIPTDATVKRQTVSVRDVTVSGGNIDITSSAVDGTGKIYANNAEGISIKNTSNMALTLQDIVILDEGGHLTFNGYETGSFEGFTGEIRSRKSDESPSPSFTIDSHFDGSITMTSNGQTNTVKPDVTITLNGQISNHAGDLSINSGSDIVSTASISAAGQLNMTASGSITQSYKSGITNIGGDVSTLWKSETDELWNKKSSGQSISSSDVRIGQGGMIAGGDIILAGDIININGLIQSGFAQYGINLDIDSVTQKIQQIETQWQNSGKPSSINPRTDSYQISQGGYALENNQYVYKTSAWYDPVNKRIILDDINPQGGHVSITGRIANTGGGKIVVADGHATVNVNAGQYDLQAGNISTGTVAGSIQLTDLSYSNDSIASKVTQYTRNADGKTLIKTWDINRSDGSQSGYTETVADAGSTSYSPKDGLFYTWAKGQSTSTTTVKTTSQDFTIWGLFDIHDENLKWTENTTTDVVESLDIAETVGTTITRPTDVNGDLSFYAWSIQVQNTDTSTVETTWTTYDNWTHCSGTHHAEVTTKTGKVIQYLYTVNADQAIGTDFVTGNNSITLVSGGNVYLGGNLTANNGTVSVQAGNNILNTVTGNSIAGAKNVTFEATNGDVGSSSNNIRLSSTSGALNLKATAGGLISIDGSSLDGQSSTVATLNAGSSISLITSGNLETTQLKGTDLFLKSLSGSIKAQGVEQIVKSDKSQRFDARTFSGSIEVNATGNLAIGQIESGSNVTINVTDGALTDALPRDGENALSVEERLSSWIQAGILGKDGTTLESRYAEDLTKLENEVEGAWSRYVNYQNLKSSMNEAQKQEYASLQTRFEGCSTLDEALTKEKGTTGTLLNTLVNAEANYHAWNKTELIYAVADSIINPDASTSSKAITPNIQASGTITLNAINHLIGEEEDSVIYDLKTQIFDGNGQLTAIGQQLYESLARADADDVAWDKTNATVTISLKRPITVDLGNSDQSYVDAEAKSIYLQTLEDKQLRFHSIHADEHVRLTSGTGILGKDANNLIAGRFITLHGGKGSIGQSATRQTIPVRVSTADDGWITATAQGDIHLTEVSGAMVISSLATEGQATLTTDGASILSRDMGDATVTGVISAQSLALNVGAKGSIGSEGNALRLYDVNSLYVSSNISGLYLDITGASTTVNSLESSNLIQSSGTVDIDSTSGVTVTPNLEANGPISIDATNQISVQSITSTGNGTDITLTSTSDRVDVHGNLTVSNTENSDIALSGESVNIDSGITLSASSGHISANGNLSIGSNNTFNAKGIKFSSTQSIATESTTFNVGSEGLTITSSDDIDLHLVKIQSEGDVSLNATDQLTLSSSETEKASIDATDSSVTLKGTQVNVNDLVLTAGNTTIEAQNVVADGLQATATTGSITMIADGTITASDATLSAKEGTITLNAQGQVSAQRLTATAEAMDIDSSNADVSMQEAKLDVNSIDIDALTDVTLENATLDSLSGAMSITSTEGSIDLLGLSGLSSSSQQTISATAITLKAQKDVLVDDIDLNATSGSIDIQATNGQVSAKGSALVATDDVKLTGNALAVNSNQSITAGDAVVIKFNDSVVAEGLKVDAKTLDINSSEGSINITQANLTLDDAINLTAQTQIIAGKSTVSTSSETNSSIAMTAGSSIAVSDSTLSTSGAVTLNAQKQISAQNLVISSAQTVDIESAQSSVSVKQSTLNVTDSLSIQSKAQLELDGVSVPTELTGAFHLSSEHSDVDLTTVTSLTDGSTGLNTITAGSIEVSAGQNIKLNGNPINWTATDSTLTIVSDSLTLADNSTLSAKTDLTVDIDGLLKLGNNVSTAGGSVDLITGELEVGTGNRFESTSGSLELLAKGDTTLGGELQVSAKNADGSDAEIIIGAGGVLSVVNNDLTIKASDGSVTVYGGKGMSIQDDLTIISETDSMIKTGSGDLTIGNQATIKAGSLSGLEATNPSYGNITIDAGSNFSIGDNATILADELIVKAKDNVSFGNKATLHGATNGVTVTSETGNISMGEELTVISNAEKTILEASKGNIHIAQSGSLTSENSLIEFTAGQDILFDKNFTADGQGFTLNAGRDILVKENAHIQTEFDQDSLLTTNNGWPVTIITAGRNVEFGDNSQFDTTMLLLTAGSMDQRGDVRFGDFSRIETSELGINVVAFGDLTFGRSAIFGTTTAEKNGKVYLLAYESLAIGENATINSKDSIHIMTQNGPISIAQGASLIDHNAMADTEIVISSELGSVSIGDDVKISGRSIDIDSSNSDVQIGHGVTLLSKPESNGIIDVFAYDNLFLDGQMNVLSSNLHFSTDEGDIVFGKNSAFVTVSSNTIDKMTFQSGRDINMTQGATLFATTDLVVAANRHVSMAGNSWLYSDNALTIKAKEGNITMSDNSRLGYNIAQNHRFTNKVDLSAGGHITQVASNTNKGIMAEQLIVNAGQSVILGAIDQTTAHNGGNQTKDVQINAGNDISLALSSSTANVSINENTGGHVNGNLVLHGQDSDVTIDHDLDIQGETSLHAKRLVVKNIKSQGLLELSTNLYDHSASDGITAGSLSGHRIAILTEEGQIQTGNLQSTSDLISVARTSTTVDGVLSTGSVDSAYSLGLYNALGPINTENLHAVDTVFVISGTNTPMPDESSMTSDMDRVLTIQNSTSPSKYMTTSYLESRDASLIVPGFVPVLDISKDTLDDTDNLFPDDEMNDDAYQYASNGLRYNADARSLVGQSGYVINNYWLTQFDKDDSPYKVLFHFNSSALKPESRAVLNALISQLANTKLDAVRIQGYTDRLGSTTYNQALSEKRAEVVKNYIVSKGIPEQIVQTSGMGSSHSIVECADGENVIPCLAPNRRSEITFNIAFIQ